MGAFLRGQTWEAESLYRNNMDHAKTAEPIQLPFCMMIETIEPNSCTDRQFTVYRLCAVCAARQSNHFFVNRQTAIMCDF